ncbi:MAG: c-type cytochrome [Steroidobacteraceae bacterium]
MKLMVVPLAATLVGISACANQSSGQPIAQDPGARLYRSLCASCHGVQARGDGPLAPLIKIGVPDLTTLAQRNGGAFPSYSVRRAIDGRFDHPAHGARDMPVWGWRLYDPAVGVRDDREARARTGALIEHLVTYLESVQQ